MALEFSDSNVLGPAAAAGPYAWLRRLLAVCVFLAVGACAMPDERQAGKLPDGTVSVLLTHLKSLGESNQKVVADLEYRKDWDGLAKAAEAGIKLDPHNADWWFVAGYAYSRSDRHGLAVARFTERVRLAPDDILGSNMLAQAYRDSGQPARALQVLNNAHLTRPGTPATYYLLGECYTDLNRFLPAAAAYRESVKLDAKFTRSWFGLGRSAAELGNRGDYDQALKALRELDPALAKELAAIRPRARSN
jgi:tetratricopeptide (TPR) repeat protein